MQILTGASPMRAIPSPVTARAPLAPYTGNVSWRQAAAVLAVILLWLGATGWIRPLTLPDEGRYVGVAWEMVRSGEWLTPTLNGLPFFHKPPLFYWIAAGSMSLFGPHEWAARAAPLLGAAVGAFSIYLFIQRWSGDRAARLTLLALLAQPLFYVGAQFANLDMLVAGCITVTILLAAHASLCFEQRLPYLPALVASYAMAGLGVLAKGLIGAVLPALVIAVWLVLLRRRRTLGRLLSLTGLLLFLLIATPWFVAMQVRFPDFFNYFFVVQHFKRFAAGGFNNVEPFWFYPVLLGLFFAPWLAWLWRSIRREADWASDPVRVLMVVWVLVVVGFFSLPQSKLVGYVLPVLAPLAALLANGLLRRGEPSRRDWWRWKAASAASIVVSVGVVVALALLPREATRDLAATLRSERGPDETVFMVGKYEYDFPFYAKLASPVRVVEDWKAADIALHDNGRKELADASGFAPATAAQLLINPASFPLALCERRTTWVLGPVTAVAQYPFLATLSVANATSKVTLWKVDMSAPGVAGALGCLEAAAGTQGSIRRSRLGQRQVAVPPRAMDLMTSATIILETAVDR